MILVSQLNRLGSLVAPEQGCTPPDLLSVFTPGTAGLSRPGLVPVKSPHRGLDIETYKWKI